MRRKINNDFIDNYFIENKIKIKRCDDFVVSNNIMNWECLIDGHKWKARAGTLLKKLSPTRCPKCKGGVQHTFKEVVDILENLKIELIDTSYENYAKKLNCKCKKCNNIFKKSLRDIKNFDRNIKYKTPCPNCNNRLEYNNDWVDTQLIKNKRNIIRLSNITKAKDTVEWKCVICNTTWMAIPQSILSKYHNTGCPTCKNKKENLLKRYLIDNITSDYFKPQYKIYIDNRKRIIDFCLIKNSIVYFIERNGEQHYQPTNFNGMCKIKAIANYEKQIIKDKQLKEFCEEYNIKLIIIKYDMKQEEIENIFINL